MGIEPTHIGITIRGLTTWRQTPYRNTLDLQPSHGDQTTFDLLGSCVQFRVFLYGHKQMLTGFEPAPPALTMITQSANLWSLSRGRCACQYTKQPVYVHCSTRRAVLYHIETLSIIFSTAGTVDFRSLPGPPNRAPGIFDR